MIEKVITYFRKKSNSYKNKKMLINLISKHVEIADVGLEEVIHVDLMRLINDFDNITVKDIDDIVNKLIIIHSRTTVCAWRIEDLKKQEQV